MADPSTTWTSDDFENVTRVLKEADPLHIDIDPLELCRDPLLIDNLWTADPSADPSTSWTASP